MGLFTVRKPRGFRRSYIYYDERKEKLEKIKESGKKPMHPMVGIALIIALLFLMYFLLQ